MNKVLGDKKIIALFTLPSILIFSLMVIYPIIQTVQKSFYNWDGLTEPIFSGLDNYKELFSDSLFYQSTINGIIYAIILVVLQVGLATLLALILLNDKMPFRRFFRSAFFLPVVLSVTVVCQLWSSIYNPEFGLLNNIFEFLHIPYAQDWLADPKAALIAVAIVNVWQNIGYQFAIIYAGAKSIPSQYREAAMIDGATNFEINVKIILPMLVDTYKTCLIIAITGGLNAFAHMHILTKGGPGTSTYSLTYMTFRSAFTIGEYGYGCAVAVALIIQCIVATFIVRKLLDKEPVSY